MWFGFGLGLELTLTLTPDPKPTIGGAVGIPMQSG